MSDQRLQHLSFGSATLAPSAAWPDARSRASVPVRALPLSYFVAGTFSLVVVAALVSMFAAVFASDPYTDLEPAYLQLCQKESNDVRIEDKPPTGPREERHCIRSGELLAIENFDAHQQRYRTDLYDNGRVMVRIYYDDGQRPSRYCYLDGAGDILSCEQRVLIPSLRPGGY